MGVFRACLRGRRRAERGVAAVEFALVCTVFFPLLFGIIDYGLYFDNSLNARQGVREEARRAVVQTVSGSCGSPGITVVSLNHMRCDAGTQIGALAGKAYVKVTTGPQGWVKGQPLAVCTLVKVSGIAPFVPFPNGGWIKSSTQMSIEVDTPVPTDASASTTSASADPSLPAGQDWNWCTTS